MKSELDRLGTEILLQSLMDTVQDGVTVIDREMRVVYQNEAIRQMFGSIIGRQCYEAYRGRTEPCSFCSVLKVFEDGEHHHALEDTRLPDGRVIWMECSCGPLKNDAGEVVGAVEIVRNVTDRIRLTDECATLRREVRKQVDFTGIVTQSRTMKELFRIIDRVAATRSPVLLMGESGTGKELFAKAIWQNSDRKDGPFVPVNCSAIPANLLESELFGHEKGAFTGATAARVGLVESADGGTLFLDEIGEIPRELQSKLLRFLQDGECRRVGAQRARRLDVRVITATNRDLEEALREGAFREDLYYRISVIPMYLPPLRHRREDIPLLATHFLQRLCDEYGRSVSGITPEALRALLQYSWPGNVRELENLVEYALHFTDDGQSVEYALHFTDDGQSIGVDQLPANFVERSTQPTAAEFARAGALVSIEEYTKQTILALQSDHKEEEIAGLLGISRKTLWEKRKRWDLPRPGP